ncbi:MAG: VCBS domain-containing protein, partial [bacterium]
MDLNGVNANAYDYVVSNVALNLVPTKYTVAFWVKADAVGYWNPIIGEEFPGTTMTGPDWGNFLFHSGPSGVVYMGQNGGTRFSLAEGTLAVGSWTHFAMTFDNGTASAYVNGTLAGTQTGWAYGSTWSQFYLGGPQSWEGTDAKLDDIRIYDGALSTSDIRMIANPPLLGAIESTSAAYTENGAAVSLTSALTLSDADNSSMSSATIAIVRNRTVGDVLTFTNQNGITGAYNSNTGVLTLSGISSSANYQAALRSVQFSSTSDDPTAGGSASTRTIAFLVNDGQLDSNPVRRVVDVTPLNDAPVAVADSAIAVERGGYPDGSVGLDPTGNVLTNDMDLDGGDTKTVSGVAAGVGGSASANVGSAVTGTYGSIDISSTGAYTYTVDNTNATVQALRTSGQTITDVFTYTVTDSGGLTSTTQITVTIQGANDAPTSVADTATAVEAGGLANGTAGTNPTGNVLTNDTDPDSAVNGETKTVVGILAGTQTSASGNVATSVTGTYGSITIAANGAYTYTVDNTNAAVQALRTSGNTLSDVFTYTMNDASGVASTTQITVTIQGANDTPTAVVDTATAIEAGGTANGNAGTNPTGNVLTNDTDVDAGDTKTVSGVAAGEVGSASANVGFAVTGTYGSISISSTGAYTYTVDNTNATVQALRTSGNTLTDVFTYTMTDTGGATSTTQITVTIQGANDAPTAVFDTAMAVEAGGITNGTAGMNPTGNVLANDADPDSAANGETKTVVGVLAGTQASASGNVAASVTG